MYKNIILIIIILLIVLSIIFRNIIYVNTTIEADMYNVKYETNYFIRPFESYKLEQDIVVEKEKLNTDAKKLINEAEKLCVETGTLDYILIDNVTYEEYRYLTYLVKELENEKNIGCSINYKASEEESSNKEYTLVTTAIRAITPVIPAIDFNIINR